MDRAVKVIPRLCSLAIQTPISNHRLNPVHPVNPVIRLQALLCTRYRQLYTRHFPAHHQPDVILATQPSRKKRHVFQACKARGLPPSPEADSRACYPHLLLLQQPTHRRCVIPRRPSLLSCDSSIQRHMGCIHLSARGQTHPSFQVRSIFCQPVILCAPYLSFRCGHFPYWKRIVNVSFSIWSWQAQHKYCTLLMDECNVDKFPPSPPLPELT